MHALGRYLDEEIRRRGWTASELARRAGLTKQSVSNLMAADKSSLGRMLERRTFAGLSEALGVPAELLVLKAAEAMDIPMPPPPVELAPTTAPPALTSIEKVGVFLRESDLPSETLRQYLRQYHQLSLLVWDILDERMTPR